MSRFRRYEEVSVGDLIPPEPLRFEIDSQVCGAFLAATGNDADLYGVRDGDRAPSMIASVYLIDLLKARCSPPGGIHAKQAIRFHRAVRTGESLSLQGRITDKYVRKERPYVVADFEARSADGELVSSGRITSIWGKDQ